MDTTTRKCYDCLWKCANCTNASDCYNTCRGDRVFDDGTGSGIHCTCPPKLVDDGVSENCNCKIFFLFIKNKINFL